MAKNDLILLDGIIDEYRANNIPSNKLDEVFEYFATEQILKDYDFTREEILSGSVDGHNDGGIDEFYIIVNGHLAEKIPIEVWPRTNSELVVYFITCKHEDSFRQLPINNLIASIQQLLDFSIPSSELTSSYNEKVLRKREQLISTYKKLAISLSKFEIRLFYACRGTEEIEENIRSKAKQAETICENSFSECNAIFEFIGNSKLLEIYRERPNEISDLRFDKCIELNGQYVVLVRLDHYRKFITDSKGNLCKRLFESNVRDYLGMNPVNTDIQKTLKDHEGPDFWWLNNGITIIGTHAHIVANTIYITDVQIVNGLQTSESIFSYYTDKDKEQELSEENRSVLVKILITEDNETKNKIIFATNNQTNVNVPALRANDKIQIDIDDMLRSNGIYYERRINYYQNQDIPEDKIISPLSLAAGYICLIYKNPHLASHLKQKFMRDNRKYERVFSSRVDINLWVVIAKLILLTDKYLNEIGLGVGSKAFKLHKHFRHLILFMSMARLFGSFAFTENDLIKMSIAEYSKELFLSVVDDIQEIDSECFSRVKRPSMLFHYSCCELIEQKYGIKAIKSVRDKNQQIWPNAIAIRD